MMKSVLTEPEQATPDFVEPDGVSPEDRLAIYRNTYISGATRALRLNYPAVHRLVGDEFFEGMAQIFIAAHPPQTTNLDGYGAALSEFLSTFESAKSLAYLPAVARLEWMVSRVLHAEDVPALDLTRLSELSPEEYGRLCFSPNPSAGLVYADCPADEIWRAVLDGDDEAMAAIDPDAGPVWLLVRRLETGVDVARLEEMEARFLLLLIDGMPLDGALLAAADINATAVLARFLTDGVFTDFDFAPIQQSQGVFR
jgi:hypothetical protein